MRNKRYKHTYEIEYEKQKEECSFKPDLKKTLNRKCSPTSSQNHYSKFKNK